MIGKRLLWEAARRLATDPRVQEKAAELAHKAYSTAQPKLENAGRHISESMRDAVKDADPLEHPGEFLKSFKRRLLPPADE